MPNAMTFRGHPDYLVLCRTAADHLREILGRDKLDEQKLRAIVLACISKSWVPHDSRPCPFGVSHKGVIEVNGTRCLVNLVMGCDDRGVPKPAPNGVGRTWFLKDCRVA